MVGTDAAGDARAAQLHRRQRRRRRRQPDRRDGRGRGQRHLRQRRQRPPAHARRRRPRRRQHGRGQPDRDHGRGRRGAGQRRLASGVQIAARATTRSAARAGAQRDLGQRRRRRPHRSTAPTATRARQLDRHRRDARLDLGNGGSGVEIDGGDDNRVGETTRPRREHDQPQRRRRRHRAGRHRQRDRCATRSRPTTSTASTSAPTARPPNDALDADAGANDLQNGPEIQSATATSVDWELESDPRHRYRLEFYANDAVRRLRQRRGADVPGSTVRHHRRQRRRRRQHGHHDARRRRGRVSMTATRLELVFGGGFPPRSCSCPRSTSELSPCELTV